MNKGDELKRLLERLLEGSLFLCFGSESSIENTIKTITNLSKNEEIIMAFSQVCFGIAKMVS